MKTDPIDYNTPEGMALLDAEFVERYGVAYCPHCGIHLDNGCSSHDPQYNEFDKTWMYNHDKYLHCCLGCGEEFGPELEVVETPKKTGKKHPKNMTLRAQLFERFAAGDSVKKCEIEFGITYGNAHYHYRNWKKQS